MAFKRMTDMSYGEGEGMKATFPKPSLLSGPDYPPGLCLTLTERDLKKLDLEADCSPGDMLHMAVMGRVCSVNKAGDGTTISLQVTDISLEDESTEAPDKDED